MFLGLSILLLVNSGYLDLYAQHIPDNTETSSLDIAPDQSSDEDAQHVLSSLSLDAVVMSTSLVLSPFTINWISFDFPEIINLSYYVGEAPRQIPEISTIFCRIIQINAP